MPSQPYTPLGFLAAKRKTIAALKGDIQHEPRAARKNLLAIGQVTPDDVAAAVARCQARQYTSSAHHRDAQTEVHVFRPGPGTTSVQRRKWYIKLYFRSGIVFISVH